MLSALLGLVCGFARIAWSFPHLFVAIIGALATILDKAKARNSQIEDKEEAPRLLVCKAYNKVEATLPAANVLPGHQSDRKNLLPLLPMSTLEILRSIPGRPAALDFPEKTCRCALLGCDGELFLESLHARWSDKQCGVFRGGQSSLLTVHVLPAANRVFWRVGTPRFALGIVGSSWLCFVSG